MNSSRQRAGGPAAIRPSQWQKAAWALLGAIACSGASAQTVYVSSEKDHKVNLFDAGGKLQSTIAVCQRPRDMKPSADGSRIHVVCGDGNQLGVIDRASGKMIDRIPVADSPEIMALSPDGKTAYVSIEDESVLAAYDLASKKTLF